jgi:phospholipid/cholesterol/gamma-HCH transport system substrate-binding protein
VNELMAKLVAVATAALLAATLAAVWITSHPGASGTTVRAEFDDVYPLLPGMYVRVDGAIAGSVGAIEISDDGTAIVSMELFDGTSPPRADATAAIRQQDITGDSYVALEPGSGSEPLGDEVIGMRSTVVAPRFDDLLNSFTEPVRQGLELLLIESGKGLERRGADLNAAVLELRPGLAAADTALAEVRSQNAALRSLVVDAEAVVGQAAGRSRELGALVDGLSATLRTTAEHGQALDAAVERLPQTSERARETLGRLADLAVGSVPLARTLNRSAPDLAESFRLLGPFLDDAKSTMDAVAPTLALVENLLVKSLPTLREAPSRVLTAPLDIAAAAGAVLDALLGEEELQKALFSADGYGHGPRSEDDVGLGAIGVEEGDQANYGDWDPLRYFLRAETVITCETFGLVISPGCLLEAAGARSQGDGGGGTEGGDGEDDPVAGAPPSEGDDGGDTGSEAGAPPSEEEGGPLGDTLGPAGEEVDQILDDVEGVLDEVGGNGEPPDLDAAEDLLGFLTGR